VSDHTKIANVAEEAVEEESLRVAYNTCTLSSFHQLPIFSQKKFVQTQQILMQKKQI